MHAWRWWELVFILKTKDLYIGGGKVETETSLEFNALLFLTYWSWPPDCWGIVAVRGTMQADKQSPRSSCPASGLNPFALECPDWQSGQTTTSKQVSGFRAKSSRSRMLALKVDNIKITDPHFSFIDVRSAAFYTQRGVGDCF